METLRHPRPIDGSITDISDISDKIAKSPGVWIGILTTLTKIHWFFTVFSDFLGHPGFTVFLRESPHPDPYHGHPVQWWSSGGPVVVQWVAQWWCSGWPSTRTPCTTTPGTTTPCTTCRYDDVQRVSGCLRGSGRVHQASFGYSRGP